jgi:catechol 2,3-dioxygenase-like lactoylglutathione lyase family enzyme
MNIVKLVPELICSDIERSIKFYTDVLNFTILFSRPEERFAYLDHEGAQLMIEQPTVRCFLADKLAYPYGRGINLQINTSDVDALYDKIQIAKAKIYLPMEDKQYRCDERYLTNRQFIVQDPDGYLLRFYGSIETSSLI